MDTIVCVTMRYGSRRLPGKALLTLGGGYTPVRLLQAQLANVGHTMVVCCPEDKDDDPIAEHCLAVGCECFRGSLNNVLGRMLKAAESYGVNRFVRITGDDLFVDPTRLCRLVAEHGDPTETRLDLTYSNLPKGTECQVISTKFAARLVEAYGEDTELWDKRPSSWEGATLNFVPLSPIEASEDTFAIELDTYEDAETIRRVLDTLAVQERKPPFLIEDLARIDTVVRFPKRKHPMHGFI